VLSLALNVEDEQLTDKTEISARTGASGKST
jgi:hypothetical protein